MGCNIFCGKPPKLVRRSHRRIRSSVLLVRFAQPAKLRLRKTRAFFSAQDDRLIVCLVICVCFRRHPSKLRFASWQICSAKIATALRCVIKIWLHILAHEKRSFSGDHRSPLPVGFYTQKTPSFSAGCPGGHPLQEIFIFSVGANCVRPALYKVTVHFRTCNARPYRLNWSELKFVCFRAIRESPLQVHL